MISNDFKFLTVKVVHIVVSVVFVWIFFWFNFKKKNLHACSIDLMDCRNCQQLPWKGQYLQSNINLHLHFFSNVKINHCSHSLYQIYNLEFIDHFQFQLIGIVAACCLLKKDSDVDDEDGLKKAAKA